MDYTNISPEQLNAGAWVEVNLDALRENFRTVRSIVGEETRICSVIKSDAYGVGVNDVARVLEEEGSDYFAVAVLDEGIELRKMGVRIPILILGPLMPHQASYVLKYDLTQTVCSYEMAEELSRVAFKRRKICKIHVKMDTGMGRIGVGYEDAPSLISRIRHLPYIHIEGLFTHFATADSQDKSYVFEQMNNFRQVMEHLKRLDIRIPIKHVATSATIIDLPEFKLDMVRPGLMLYGIYPHPAMREKVQLKPMLSLKARISFLKEIHERQSISYGRRYFAEAGQKIATLPLGYNDGIRRLLTNRGEILVGGIPCPMVGTVCMDHVMLDVSKVPDVQRLDEAVIIGKQKDKEISPDQIAQRIDTISYEILCGLSRRLPRLYFEGEKLCSIRNLLGYHRCNDFSSGETASLHAGGFPASSSRILPSFWAETDFLSSI